MKKLVLLFLTLVFAIPCLAEASDPFVGQWQDPVYGRALLEIVHDGDNYAISIHWGNSADSEGVWEMNAARDGNSLVYTGGKMSIITYAEGGDVVSDDIKYEDAEGAFTLGDDGKLYWADSREDRAPEFALERVQSAAMPLSGGWTPSADPTITDELKAIFEAGTDTLTGISYVPVAYMGSQVVAGTNHAFLCQTASAYPGVEGMKNAPAYAMVYLYEDLSGKVSILSIADLDVGAYCEYGPVEGDDTSADGAPAEDVPADDATVADEAAPEETESDALAEALEALHKARREKAQEELKAELDEYVTTGKLTQEQADLIMKHFQEHFQDMERDDRPGDFFSDWMNGEPWGGEHMDGNHMGGQKEYGNWKFGWSFDWHFPGQQDGDNSFHDMFGWNHR